MHRRQRYRRQGGTLTGVTTHWLQWWLLLVGVATSAWVGPSLGIAAPQQATAPVIITIKVLDFVPPDITIPVGTRVAWVNDGGRHQIVADNGAFKSRPLSKAREQFVYQFRRAGVFPYHCHFHGGQDGKGMAGVVTVVERTP
jgi:plastocyanin